MEIVEFEISLREPDFALGHAVDKGIKYRFIASIADGEVARLEVWEAELETWVIDLAPPPLSLVALIREQLGIEKPVYAGWVAAGWPPQNS